MDNCSLNKFLNKESKSRNKFEIKLKRKSFKKDNSTSNLFKKLEQNNLRTQINSWYHTLI